MRKRKYESELAKEYPYTESQIQVLRGKVDEFLEHEGIAKNSNNREILTRNMIEYCMKQNIELQDIALTL